MDEKRIREIVRDEIKKMTANETVRIGKLEFGDFEFAIRNENEVKKLAASLIEHLEAQCKS